MNGSVKTGSRRSTQHYTSTFYGFNASDKIFTTAPAQHIVIIVLTVYQHRNFFQKKKWNWILCNTDSCVGITTYRRLLITGSIQGIKTVSYFILQLKLCSY